MPDIELKNAVARYSGETVLDNINLNIRAGEKLALVGESGSGKSTLLQMIYEQCGQNAALVPQGLGLVPALSVFHNVYMGQLHMHSSWKNALALLHPPEKEVEDVKSLLTQLRMQDKVFEPAGELSGGQQQRTALARALYHPASILLADEPVSAVDEHHALEILKLLVTSKQTVVMALHDCSQALAFTDRVIGLKHCRIVFDKPAAAFSAADQASLYRPE